MKNARLAALIVSGGLCSATPALAQTPGAGDATPPSATQPAPTPTPPPAGPPPPAPAAENTDENLFRFYGTLTPRFVMANGAMESFSPPVSRTMGMVP